MTDMLLVQAWVRADDIIDRVAVSLGPLKSVFWARLRPPVDESHFNPAVDAQTSTSLAVPTAASALRMATGGDWAPENSARPFSPCSPLVTSPGGHTFAVSGAAFGAVPLSLIDSCDQLEQTQERGYVVNVIGASFGYGTDATGLFEPRVSAAPKNFAQTQSHQNPVALLVVHKPSILRGALAARSAILDRFTLHHLCMRPAI